MSAEAHAQALWRYLSAQLGPLTFIEHDDTPWHSATFDGARHRFMFAVDPAVDIAAFALILPEAEIPLPGGFVADALVTGIRGNRITVDLLTIEAA